MKKYSIQIKLLGILLIILYVIPICFYLFSDLETINFSNILFILYPTTYFICSTVEARYSENFYLFPIGSSILFIPLVFTMYDSKYLLCFFLYLIIAILGGLLGCWFNEKEDARKSIKQAIGIMCIVGSIFSLIANILYYSLYKCRQNICYLSELFNVNNCFILIIIIGLFLLGIYFLKKKKKKD